MIDSKKLITNMLGKNQRDSASKAKIKVNGCKAVTKVSSLKNKQEQ